MIHLRYILLPVFVLCAQLLHAQVPFRTQVDTVAANKRKQAKEKCAYTLEQKYDSATGKLPSNASFDTLFYTRYNKSGRETEFCYYDENRDTHHTWLFYDKHGRVIRALSTNADSTEGFEERWYYGDAYQVLKEERYTVTWAERELYHYTTFTYNSRGQLTSQWEYYVDDETEDVRNDKLVVFTYNQAGMEILKTTRNGSGDTLYVDSTFYGGNKETFHLHRYALDKNEVSGKNKWILRSYYATTCDTVNGVVVNTYDQRFYDYRTGVEQSRNVDTLVSNFAGNVIEIREENYVEKVWFNSMDEYQYSIRYNRAGQPISRRTAYTTYYQ